MPRDTTGWSPWAFGLATALDEIRAVRDYLTVGKVSLAVRPLCSAQRLLGQASVCAYSLRLAGHSVERVRRALLHVQDEFEAAVTGIGDVPLCWLCRRTTPANDRIRYRGRWAHASCSMADVIERHPERAVRQ